MTIRVIAAPTPISRYKLVTCFTANCQTYATVTRSAFLRAPACNASRVLAIVEASVRLSHSWSVLKRCKLELRNLHCFCPKDFSLSR